MRVVLVSVFLLLGLFASAQQYSLNGLLKKGEQNYPLAKQHQFIDASTELKLKNLNTRFYPQLDFAGQISWQNDVPHVESDRLPFEMPMAPKDQYKAYVDLKQIIYDGGAIKATKKVEEVKSEVEHQKVKVDIYSIRKGIISSFYLSLSLDEQLKQIDRMINNLDERCKEVKVLVEQGVALSSNLDALLVEMLKLNQNRYGVEEARSAAVQILSEYTGESLSDSVQLVMNNTTVENNDIARPEFALFNSQQKQLLATNNLLAKKRIPKLIGFGQVGYGNPGFNMLLDSFEPFYMVGLRLSWNIFNWKTTSNEKRILEQQSSIISNQEETFIKNLNVASIEIQSRIRKMERMIETDQEIIELREKITKNSSIQLKNGIIMSSDYIADLNNETIAKLSNVMHQIELNKAKTELANLLGTNL